MADEQTRQLVRMVNQIALNLGEQRDMQRAVAQTEDHLRRFWTPDMRGQLVAYWQTDGSELSPAAAAVAEQLAGQISA